MATSLREFKYSVKVTAHRKKRTPAITSRTYLLRSSCVSGRPKIQQERVAKKHRKSSWGDMLMVPCVCPPRFYLPCRFLTSLGFYVRWCIFSMLLINRSLSECRRTSPFSSLTLKPLFRPPGYLLTAGTQHKMPTCLPATPFSFSLEMHTSMLPCVASKTFVKSDSGSIGDCATVFPLRQDRKVKKTYTFPCERWRQLPGRVYSRSFRSHPAMVQFNVQKEMLTANPPTIPAHTGTNSQNLMYV